MDQAAGSPVTWWNIIFGSVGGRDMILWPNRHLTDSPSVGDGVIASSFSQGCVQVSIYHRQGATNRPVNNSTQGFLGELVSLTYRNTRKEILTEAWPLMDRYQVKEELTLNFVKPKCQSLMEGLPLTLYPLLTSSDVFVSLVSCSCTSSESFGSLIWVSLRRSSPRCKRLPTGLVSWGSPNPSCPGI